MPSVALVKRAEIDMPVPKTEPTWSRETCLPMSVFWRETYANTQTLTDIHYFTKIQTQTWKRNDVGLVLAMHARSSTNGMDKMLNF